MNKRTRRTLLLVAFVIVLAFVGMCFQRMWMAPAFFAMQAESIANAGTWEDDPKNWHRAFGIDPPAEVTVIHSKYWRSSHFTAEFIYYFEISATPEWRDAFLKQKGLVQVPPSQARSFRTNMHGDDIPEWFAPEPVELYDVWDIPRYFGSVWINKTNGHIHFYAMHL